MKPREFFVRRWRGIQAASVLLALGLTVLVTIRIDRGMLQPTPDAVADPISEAPAFADELDASKPKYWGLRKGPDQSTMMLVTKCVDGSVFYQFDVRATPKMFARYERTYGKAPRFQLALLDSTEFKTGSISIMQDDLIAANDSTGKVAYLSARDAIKLPCKEYQKLETWEPAWTLAR